MRVGSSDGLLSLFEMHGQFHLLQREMLRLSRQKKSREEALADCWRQADRIEARMKSASSKSAIDLAVKVQMLQATKWKNRAWRQSIDMDLKRLLSSAS